MIMNYDVQLAWREMKRELPWRWMGLVNLQLNQARASTLFSHVNIFAVST